MTTPSATKRDQIVDGLCRPILDGELARGQRMPQGELAKRFGASIILARVKGIHVMRRLTESYAMKRAALRFSRRDLIVAGGVLKRIQRQGAEGDRGGFFYRPTLFDHVPPGAVTLANGTGYALVAAVWTRDSGRAHRLADDVQAGQTFVNTYGAAGGVELPFGGWKRSGYGHEKGCEGMLGYTQTKTVAIGVR